MSSWTHTKDLPEGYWTDGEYTYRAQGDGCLRGVLGAWFGRIGNRHFRPATPEEIETFGAVMEARREANQKRQEEEDRRAAEAEKRYGFDPRNVGLRPRGFWTVEYINWEEECAGAQIGDLCVQTRDGASNPPDMSAGQYGCYRGTAQDSFDSTYRYYYYAPLQPESEE